MANQVSVGINVNDNSRRALAQLRSSMQRTSRDIRRSGGTVRFNVTVPPGAARRDIRRIQRMLRRLPVNLNTTLIPPPTRTVRQQITRALANFRARINTRLNAPSGAARRALLRRLGQLFTVPVTMTFRGGRSILRGVFRPLIAMVSGMLNDGIGQGILGAFRAAGPVGMAILAGAITAGAALIGAALAAVLVFGFGAAFVGLGVMIAKESDVIQRNWKTASENMKESFKGAGDALIPVVHRAIHVLEKAAADFAPHFKRAMETAAPVMDKFLTSLDKGIREFGKRAFEPMMKGFDAFMLAFGPEFEAFLEGLGDAFGNLGRTAQRHSGELAMALRMVLGLITTLIDIVNFFANVWAQALRFITFNIGLMFQAFAVMISGVVTGMSGILSAMAEVADFLPGPLASKIRGARDNFKVYGEGVVSDLRRMSQDSKNWGLTMDRANKRRKLEVDIASLQARLKQARTDLTNTANKKAKAKVQANIDNLTAQLRKARNDLNSLNGKTATTFVQTVYLSGNRAAGGDGTRGGRLAHGGNVGAAATGGVRQNMTLVGEQGPELVDLPGGSHVRSNSDSRRFMGKGGAGGGETVIRIEAGHDDMSRLLLKILRNAIRVQGGDVQLVLGRG